MDPNTTVETPTGEVETPAEGAVAPVDSPTTTPKEDGKSGDGIQGRFDQITKEKHEAQREAAYWRGIAEAKKTPEPPPPEPPKAKELNPEDFSSDADYLRAVAAQTKEEVTREIKGEHESNKKRQEQQTLLKQYNDARAKTPDFDQVALNPHNPVTTTMFEAAKGENLTDILYHLGKNPDVAGRIATLSPTEQIKEIGKIEVKINQPAPQQKTVTDAPDPPTTVEGKGPATVKNQNDMKRTELHASWHKARLAKYGA